MGPLLTINELSIFHRIAGIERLLIETANQYKYNITGIQTAGNLSRNGLNPFAVKIRNRELTNDLQGLKAVILVIANLWVEVFLNCVSTLDQDIASISVKLKIHSSFYFVVEIRNHNNGILKSQKPIGRNIRRHTDERNGKLARVSN